MILKVVFSSSYVFVVIGCLGMIEFTRRFPFTTALWEQQYSEIRLLDLNGLRVWQLSWSMIILGTAIQFVDYWVN